MICGVCGIVFERGRSRIKEPKSCSIKCGKRLYYLENKERLDAYRAEWGKKNKDRQVAYVRKCRRAKPEHYRVLKLSAENARRARKMGLGEHHTKEQWLDLLARAENRCMGCGRGDLKMTKDHIVPLSLGGTDTIDNIQPLCRPCNSSKFTKHIDYRNEQAVRFVGGEK
jgi:5-methylcytosine-specific restriction endonuclease McrA